MFAFVGRATINGGRPARLTVLLLADICFEAATKTLPVLSNAGAAVARDRLFALRDCRILFARFDDVLAFERIGRRLLAQLAPLPEQAQP